MRERQNKTGSGQSIILAIVSIVVAIFLSYIGINHNVNQRIDASSQQTGERIDALNLQMSERLDKIFAKLDVLNREMGEMKVEMKLRFDDTEERPRRERE